jgi:hypothetical protein
VEPGRARHHGGGDASQAPRNRGHGAGHDLVLFGMLAWCVSRGVGPCRHDPHGSRTAVRGAWGIRSAVGVSFLTVKVSRPSPSSVRRTTLAPVARTATKGKARWSCTCCLEHDMDRGNFRSLLKTLSPARPFRTPDAIGTERPSPSSLLRSVGRALGLGNARTGLGQAEGLEQRSMLEGSFATAIVVARVKATRRGRSTRPCRRPTTTSIASRRPRATS